MRNFIVYKKVGKFIEQKQKNAQKKFSKDMGAQNMPFKNIKKNSFMVKAYN